MLHRTPSSMLEHSDEEIESASSESESDDDDYKFNFDGSGNDEAEEFLFDKNKKVITEDAEEQKLLKEHKPKNKRVTFAVKDEYAPRKSESGHAAKPSLKKKYSSITSPSKFDFSIFSFGKSGTRRRKSKKYRSSFRLRLPYTHKDDMWVAIICIISLILLAVAFYFVFYFPRYAALQVNRAYGTLGYKEAQYQAGVRYFESHEHTQQNKTRAMEWFKLAHENGHKLASFRLAHAHVTEDELKPHTGLAGQYDKILEMFKDAAKNGIPEGRHMYIKCVNGHHDCN